MIDKCNQPKESVDSEKLMADYSKFELDCLSDKQLNQKSSDWCDYLKGWFLMGLFFKVSSGCPKFGVQKWPWTYHQVVIKEDILNKKYFRLCSAKNLEKKIDSSNLI